MIDQGLNTHAFINMSTYIVRLDSHQHHESANVYEALVFLQHDMIMLKVIQQGLHVMVDLDENRQYEVELNEINVIIKKFLMISLSVTKRKC